MLDWHSIPAADEGVIFMTIRNSDKSREMIFAVVKNKVRHFWIALYPAIDDNYEACL